MSQLSHNGRGMNFVSNVLVVSVISAIYWSHRWFIGHVSHLSVEFDTPLHTGIPCIIKQKPLHTSRYIAYRPIFGSMLSIALPNGPCCNPYSILSSSSSKCGRHYLNDPLGTQEYINGNGQLKKKTQIENLALKITSTWVGCGTKMNFIALFSLPFEMGV